MKIPINSRVLFFLMYLLPPGLVSRPNNLQIFSSFTLSSLSVPLLCFFESCLLFLWALQRTLKCQYNRVLLIWLLFPKSYIFREMMDSMDFHRIMAFVYLPTILIGLLGNLLSLYAYSRKNRKSMVSSSFKAKVYLEIQMTLRCRFRENLFMRFPEIH